MAVMTRRQVVAAGAAGLTGCERTQSARHDPLLVDDQSGLNATRVSRNLTLDATSAREALQSARAARTPVSIGGARHSMGGQSLPPAHGVAAGIVGTALHANLEGRSYTAGAGARWREVLAGLDGVGWSPAVTQSNNDFSVGGSVSVNAHGWAAPRGPIGETVRRFRLMRADGSVVVCSPDENPDLFALCIGGYGLFGVLLDLELEPADNVLLERSQTRLAAEDFATRFSAVVREPLMVMAYGRLSLAEADFLRQAVLVTHKRAAEQPRPLPPLTSAGGPSALARRVFRAQVGSDAGKRLRWWAETHLGAGAMTATRNSVINVPVRAFTGHDARRRDILHEYFVPPAALNGFLADCRRVIPASRQDLLNVTLRWLEPDRRSMLAFAPEARIALVMLFSQTISSVDEADMQDLTRRLIDAALAAGGSFYLPYRLHAELDQVRRAYPRLAEFVAAKRRHDPDLRFRNQMWDRWFSRI